VKIVEGKNRAPSLMFRPKQTPPPTSHRFPKLPTVLKDTDLNFLLAEAGSRRGVLIELPFLFNGKTFMLTVKCTDESYEPVWSYYRGDDDKAQMLWQHPTGDIYLVLNLCASETGQQEQEFLPSGPNKDPARQSYTALE